jgi:hypothetical protein
MREKFEVQIIYKGRSEYIKNGITYKGNIIKLRTSTGRILFYADKGLLSKLKIGNRVTLSCNILDSFINTNIFGFEYVILIEYPKIIISEKIFKSNLKQLING